MNQELATTGSARSEEAGYPGRFFAHQAPAMLEYIAAICGRRSRNRDARFAYCDLGCGAAHTVSVLAALYPRATFYGCDSSPLHMRQARAIKEAAQLDNLELFEGSFEKFAKTPDLPAFDYVALHGVWSWIDPSARADVEGILRRRLKAGGLAMVSYNAMPGWASLEPIRRLLKTYAAEGPGDPVARVSEAYGRVMELVEGGAKFFRDNPAAEKHVRGLANADRRYLAHEYLEHGDAFYFSEVATVMHSCDLEFVGSMTPACNYSELHAGAGQPADTDPFAMELHRDFARNTMFRRDLYMRAAREEFAAAALSSLDGIYFSLVDLSNRLPFSGDSGGVVFSLEAVREAVAKVHECLAQGPRQAVQIRDAAGCSDAEAFSLIQTLVLAHHVAPCAAATPVGWSATNDALLAAAISDRLSTVALACPRTARGINLDIDSALLAWAAASDLTAEQRVSAILQRLPLQDRGAANGSRYRGLCEFLASPDHPLVQALRFFGLMR